MVKVSEYRSHIRRAVLVKSAGPRPAERDQMKRIAANPATLRALSNPVTGAPPRIDDPAWNSRRVQAISTLGGMAGGLLLPYLPAVAKFMGSGSLDGAYLASKGNLGAAAACAGAVAAPIAAGTAAKTLIEGQSGLSHAQRMRDYEDISSGRPVRPALWSGK